MLKSNNYTHEKGVKVDRTRYATARSAIDSAGASTASVLVVLPVYEIQSLPSPVVVSLPLTQSLFSHL